MHNPTPAVLAEEACLLAAFERRARVCLQMRLGVRWKVEGWEHQAYAVGAACLTLAFEAVADVDFERLVNWSLEAYEPTLASTIHDSRTSCSYASH